MTRCPYADAGICQTARPRPPLHARPSPPGAAGLSNPAGAAKACHGNCREPQEETTPAASLPWNCPHTAPAPVWSTVATRREHNAAAFFRAREVHRSKRPLLPCSGLQRTSRTPRAHILNVTKRRKLGREMGELSAPMTTISIRLTAEEVARVDEMRGDGHEMAARRSYIAHAVRDDARLACRIIHAEPSNVPDGRSPTMRPVTIQHWQPFGREGALGDSVAARPPNDAVRKTRFKN